MNKKELLMNAVRPVNAPVTNVILGRHYSGDMEAVKNEKVNNVLVLAPHMDDETIGPGGTLRQHAEQGANIHCLFITDGGSSVSDRSAEELMALRRNEIDKVQEILGLASVTYMNQPDGQVKSTRESMELLKEKINTIQPELIYCTPYIDAHVDHTATAKLLSDTLKEMEDFKGNIRMYEINCAFPPSAINVLVDTSAQHAKKVEATEVFDSQAIAFDGFLRLNQYKGKLAEPNVQTAEGFVQWDRRGFINHCETLEKMEYNFPRSFKQVNRTDTLLWAIFKNYAMKKDLYRKTSNPST
ncbi:PIG-L deacetylase family protein [Halobacillus sp. Nhm2S1]|uniref:PIG-L deacetylase family protein n=1 Tax=Halobacillus sp. Nhm2S1 TaxID=2866716 RepID=UPI001C72C74F|nr:PIG-L family deacetylase [Halobacillus sp. Nhm2S1]MBX0357756.1 PIG-L family deacetylase [Halobacillus sp. Nhm2S1]